MLVTIRFRGADLAAELQALAALLRDRSGCRDLTLGRNVDDPDLWTMVSRWSDVGSYRRALGSHEVKLHGTPTLLKALDEPSAYEVMAGDAVANQSRPRGT